MPDKAALRRRLRELLSWTDPAARSTASATLCDHLAAWPVFRQATHIALFHPTATEPDLLPLLSLPGKTFYFPLCHPDRSLTWHPPAHLASWRTSRFGIVEPDPALSPAVPAAAINLVLAPGLAFTPAGDRLGHGAGYYDRFLASLPPDVPTAGICFSCQVLPELPTAPHDVRVHHLCHA